MTGTVSRTTRRLLKARTPLARRAAQIMSPARHCAQRHADPEWRQAGALVAAECARYSDHICTSPELHAKVRHRAVPSLGQRNAAARPGTSSAARARVPCVRAGVRRASAAAAAPPQPPAN